MELAITSVGVVTAHGLGVAPLLAALREGRTGIRPAPRFAAPGLGVPLAAEAPDDAALSAAMRTLGTADPPDRASRLLLAAAAEAWRGRELAASARRAVCIGTTKGAFGLDRSDVLSWPAHVLARATGSRGPVLSLGAACASSAVALGEAMALLEEGAADEVLVGGVEALHPFLFQGFHALRALSPVPAAPFDARRAGLSLGEAGVVAVVEPLARALAAGRRPRARLLGFGTRADAHDQAAPDPTGAGLLAACEQALARAASPGAGAASIDRYHAHGSGTLQNDRAEGAVYRALFRGRAVPLTGIKGSVGHTLGAAALLDVVTCALTLEAGWVPPVAQLERLDPDIEVSAVIGGPLSSAGSRALVVSAGFGGIDAAVVLGGPDGP